MTYQRVETLTGPERRRNYTPAKKMRTVEEAFRAGVIVKDVPDGSGSTKACCIVGAA